MPLGWKAKPCCLGVLTTTHNCSHTVRSVIRTVYPLHPNRNAMGTRPNRKTRQSSTCWRGILDTNSWEEWYTYNSCSPQRMFAPQQQGAHVMLAKPAAASTAYQHAQSSLALTGGRSPVRPAPATLRARDAAPTCFSCSRSELFFFKSLYCSGGTPRNQNGTKQNPYQWLLRVAAGLRRPVRGSQASPGVRHGYVQPHHDRVLGCRRVTYCFGSC